jgi:hypothetical protein
MIQQVEEESIVGGEPTSEQLDLLAWGDEGRKKTIQTLQDALQRLVTITAGLLGGATALFVQLPAHVAAKAASTVLLLIALAVVLYGSLPMRFAFDPRCPEEIRDVRRSLENVKLRCLSWGGLFLWLAFLALVLGVICCNPA